MSCRQHGYPWPSLATSPYHSSLLAGLQGYIPYPHIAAICMFELVILPYAGVHRSTSLMSSSLLFQQCPACLVIIPNWCFIFFPCFFLHYSLSTFHIFQAKWIITIMIYSLESVFSYQRSLMVFHRSLSDSNSPQLTRTLLSTLADLNNVVWMGSTRLLIVKSSSCCLVNNPNVPITIIITVTFMFESFLVL